MVGVLTSSAMRLILATPPSWKSTEAGFLVDGELAVEMTPVGPLPDDPVAWARLRRAEPPPAEVEIVAERALAIEAGWPALLFDWRVTGAGEPVRKLVYLFQILEQGAAVMVRAPEAIYLRHHEELLRVLRGAEVDWEGQPLTLAGIWQGFVPAG